MSFILDALKKSEQERERQQQPAVMDIAYGRRSRAPRLWMMAVVGLLLLNCILLLAMWWRNSMQAPAAIAAVPTVSSANAVSSAANANVVRNNAPTVIAPPRASEVRPLQDEATHETETPDETAAALADTTPPAGPPLVRPATGLEQAMAQQETMANNLKNNSLSNNLGNAGSRTIVTGDNVPTLESLGGSGSLNLPELRLDIHVYSSVPTERFAFINTHKYLEGQTLSEGPHLDKITQDGVILSYRNQRFLLPRQ